MKRERELRELLVEVDENRRRLMGAYFTGIGLTVGQGQPRILNTLLDREGITQRELADACRFDVTTISRTLNHLEKAGFIKADDAILSCLPKRAARRQRRCGSDSRAWKKFCPRAWSRRRRKR